MEPAVARRAKFENFIVRNQFDSESLKVCLKGLARSLSKTSGDDGRLELVIFLRWIDLKCCGSLLSRNLAKPSTLAEVAKIAERSNAAAAPDAV